MISIISILQVLELREKVRNYRSRAREGSHFLSLLEDLKKYEQRLQDGNPVDSNNRKPTTPATEPSGISTPVKPRPVDETKTGQKHDGQPKIGEKSLDYEKNKTVDEQAVNQRQNADQQPGNEKKSAVEKPVEVSPLPKPAPDHHIGVNGGREQPLLWDKTHGVPGPKLKKVHSLETMSNESTITNGSSTNSPDQPPSLHKREAWGEKRPADHTHVIPPYHTTESCDGDDTCSDVTISELSDVDDDDDHRRVSYREQPINPATQRLFTGRRQDLRKDRSNSGGERHDIGITRKVVGNDRECADDGFRIVGDGRQDRRKYVGDSRQTIGNDLKYGKDKRNENADDLKRISSYSSDDERSCSVASQSSSILSVEAMHKRRALASDTLQRAKRRQAQL